MTERSTGTDAARLGRVALAGGLLLLGASVAAALLGDRQQFFRSYLLGFLYWVGLAVGSWAVLMVHHLVAGRWGFAVQRILESATRTLPLLIVMFIPIALGVGELYVWTDHARVADDHLLHHKAGYLNTPFFLARAALYFLVWLGLSGLLNRWSRRHDRSGDDRLLVRSKSLSGPGLALYVLTVTFAAFDWAMSLEPHWFSTIYGFLFIVGQGLSTFAFAIVALNALRPRLEGVAAPERFQDLGNLMLAFVMLWAYVSFSQFLIIWSGNLPEVTPWYVHRLANGWEWIGVALLVLHFAVPFVVLLSRRVKRRAEVIAGVGVAMLVMRFVDIHWLVVPSLHPDAVTFHWLDLTAPLGLGGVWLWYFLKQLRGRPLMPVRDHRWQEAPTHG